MFQCFDPLGERYQVHWCGTLVHSRQVRAGKLSLLPQLPICHSCFASVTLGFFICGLNHEERVQQPALGKQLWAWWLFRPYSECFTFPSPKGTASAQALSLSPQDLRWDIPGGVSAHEDSCQSLVFLQLSCSWLESTFPPVWEWQAKIYPSINTLLSSKKNTAWTHTLPRVTDSDGYFLWYLVS